MSEEHLYTYRKGDYEIRISPDHLYAEIRSPKDSAVYVVTPRHEILVLRCGPLERWLVWKHNIGVIYDLLYKLDRQGRRDLLWHRVCRPEEVRDITKMFELYATQLLEQVADQVWTRA